MQHPHNGLRMSKASTCDAHFCVPPAAAEIVERRRQADGGLAAVSAAADFSARLHADITYDYSARNVHEVSSVHQVDV